MEADFDKADCVCGTDAITAISVADDEGGCVSSMSSGTLPKENRYG